MRLQARLRLRLQVEERVGVRVRASAGHDRIETERVGDGAGAVRDAALRLIASGSVRLALAFPKLEQRQRAVRRR
ncbi:MAG: hypothetical protein DYH12_03855 [Sorangiineae bacterium PRO1]|nr:hypothetical protein [Sorangiineae bacterium PRO1]